MFAFVGTTLFITFLLSWHLHINGVRSGETLPLYKTIPSVFVQTLDGRTVSIDSIITRKTVLIFFSVTCPHCKSEMTNLNTLHRRFNDSLQFIALSASSSVETKRFIDSFAISFPVYVDTTLNALIQFRTATVPALYFVDRRLRLRQFRQGRHDMRSLVSLLSDFASTGDDTSNHNTP